MSSLSNFLTTAFATVSQALSGVSLNALMSPATTLAVVQYFMQRKNYIVNSAMMVSQQNGTTTLTTTDSYPVDQFNIGSTGTTGAYTIAQVASFTPSGSPNRIRVAVTTADTAVAAGDLVYVIQRLEGLRIADLRFGSSSAKTITIKFGVKAPAGTYTVGIVNGSSNRSYMAEYVISVSEANTDVVKTVTIIGDLSGTWANNNSLGFMVVWGLMAGTTFQQIAGSWGTGNVYGSTNQFNFMGTVGNTFELFDVGMYEGTTAPKFVVPDYAAELQSCQRYWEPWIGNNTSGYALFSSPLDDFTNNWLFWSFKVQKRALPTFSLGAGNAWLPAAPDNMYYSTTHFSASKNTYFYAAGSAGSVVGIANARM